MATPEMCTNCGERPAEPGKGTVPLCAVCQGLAKGKERGVRLTPSRRTEQLQESVPVKKGGSKKTAAV